MENKILSSIEITMNSSLELKSKMRMQTLCRACFLCGLFFVLLIGTGIASSEKTASIKNTHAYQFGYHSGTIEGYKKGSKTGFNDFYEYGRTAILRAIPRPDTQLGWNNDYVAGYTDGFKKGYIVGYQDERFEGLKNNTYLSPFERAF
jgi:hypothetical protein